MAAAGSDRGARRVNYYTAPEALAHGRAPPVAKKQSLIGGYPNQAQKTSKRPPRTIKQLQPIRKATRGGSYGNASAA
jgi:hypothetical protein